MTEEEKMVLWANSAHRGFKVRALPGRIEIQMDRISNLGTRFAVTCNLTYDSVDFAYVRWRNVVAERIREVRKKLAERVREKAALPAGQS